MRLAMRTTSRSFTERLSDRIGQADRAHGTLALPDLAALVCQELACHVPYDFVCLATTDPTSGVLTWAWKTRSLGVGDEEFAAAEYGPPDINKFEELVHRRPPVGVLSIDTDGHPERCRRHREFMQPRFGFTDELRAVFVSRGASWGALAAYRGPGQPPFTAADGALVAEAGELLAGAIQRCLFRVEAAGAPPVDSAPDTAGPAVLIVDPGDRPTQLTPAAHATIEELGGYDHGSLPESLLAVVATCRTSGAPFTSQVKGRKSGRWLSLRGAPLDGAATALHLSPHTVQDHLKKVFAKTGVTSRRELTARLVLG